MTQLQLIQTWRSQATQYERDGLTPAARLLERVADELELIAGGEIVTLAEAARRSGYSTDHIRVLTKKGDLQNVGRTGSPRYRAVDLPKKPGTTY